MRRREKLFGPGRAVPLDRNAKARILAYAKAWGARHRQPGQHRGPITRAFLQVRTVLSSVLCSGSGWPSKKDCY